MIGEKEIQEAKDWINIQVEEINPDTKGVMIFTFGTENYVVSGNAAKKIYEQAIPVLKEKFPNYVFLFLPFYIKVEDVINLEDLK